MSLQLAWDHSGLSTATTNTGANELAKVYGIKGTPLLSYLNSPSFPGSFPYDFMHLIWENTVKNLVLIWTGEFKGLDNVSKLDCWSCGVRAECQGSECQSVGRTDAGVKDVA